MDATLSRIHNEFPWDNQHIKSPQFYEDPHDDSVAQWMNRTFSRFRSYRKFYDQSWSRWVQIYNGQHWPSVAPGGSNHLAQLTINYSRFVVNEIVSLVLENDPEMQAIPASPMQADYADGLDTYFTSVMNRRNVNVEAQDALLDACQVGIGYLFVYWDSSLDNGQGDICVRNLPPECCFPQPGARRIDEMRQFMILRQESLAWMEQEFPDKAHLVHPSGRGDMDNTGRMRMLSNSSTFGGTNAYLEGPSSSGYGYSGDDPLVADKTHFSNPPFATAMGFEERYDVLEMWCKDESIEEKTYEIEEPRIITDAAGNRFAFMDKRTEVRLEKKYATGWRHIMTCGRVTLVDEESPYDFCPVVAVYDMKTSNEFFGQGTIQTIEPLQFELNKRRSQATNHVVLNGGAVWKVDKNAQIEWESLNNLPAQIIKYRRVTGQEIVREAGVPLPSMFFQMIEMNIRDMKVIAGVEMAGVPQKGARSGVAVKAANAVATRQIRMRVSSMEVTYKELGRRFISLIQRFVSGPRWLMVTGTGRFTGHVPFDGWNVRGQWDINIVPGSTMSTEVREQQALELFQAGAIDDIDLLSKLRWPGWQQTVARKRNAMMIESPPYQGFPGQNQDTSEGSGYAASVRAKPVKFELPEAPPPAGSPQIPMPQVPTAGNPHHYS